MFIDTEFSNSTNASRAFELRYVDTPGSRKDRAGWRRKLKRAEQQNIRRHVAEELAERERDAAGWQDMELFDYETAMGIMERDERVAGFESGEWEDDDRFCWRCDADPCMCEPPRACRNCPDWVLGCTACF
jgi:hypothetical protein